MPIRSLESHFGQPTVNIVPFMQNFSGRCKKSGSCDIVKQQCINQSYGIIRDIDETMVVNSNESSTIFWHFA
ncbi:hypothetical protein ACLOJK_031271 [Asimina triloba]